MFIENINPVIFSLGPLVFRWYGLMMLLSFILGGYYLIKNGVRQGLDEGKLLSLLIHNYLARTLPARPGVLFWLFIFYYFLLRGVIEETFRANPLYLWGYINELWGVGFFTMTHLATPFILLLAWWMIRKYKYAGQPL